MKQPKSNINIATPVIDTKTTVDASRRQFFKTAVLGAFGAATALNILPAGMQNLAYAAGSDAPEITEVKVGFIPLTDSAPIIVAAEMGFDKKYGIFAQQRS